MQKVEQRIEERAETVDHVQSTEAKRPTFRLDISKLRSKDIVIGESSSTSYSGCTGEA